MVEIGTKFTPIYKGVAWVGSPFVVQSFTKRLIINTRVFPNASVLSKIFNVNRFVYAYTIKTHCSKFVIIDDDDEIIYDK